MLELHNGYKGILSMPTNVVIVQAETKRRSAAACDLLFFTIQTWNDKIKRLDHHSTSC